ncbi:MAG: hypothetical protein K2I49_01475, partial [Ureaplasma sp.]|nr:hypothetical protein [Ureaplasma sp.]
MKKSIRKIIFSTSAALLSCATVASVIVSTACSSSNSNVNNNYYLSALNSKSSDFVYKYDKKIFSTLDDLATYYINKIPDSVTSDFYLGDVNSSILDPSTSMLDINDFKPYEPSRLHPVYLNALNMPTHDYNAAKNT